MIITIDTAKDSHEDIKKLITFLKHHVGESIYENKTSDNDIPTPSSGMFGMFDDDQQLQPENTMTDAASFLEDDIPEEKASEEKIDILPY